MEADQVYPSTQPSAAERTPIELWRMFLLAAVESPLLPRNGDDILDGMILFSHGCLSLLRHQNIEALRCRLRLVCRVWNAILQDEGAHISYLYKDRLHLIPLHSDGNRKIRRIELIPRCALLSRYCGARCGISLELEKRLQPTVEDLQWIEHLQLSDDVRRAFPTEIIMDILDNASRLRALYLRMSSDMKQNLADVLNHPTLAQLTHLSIGLLGAGYGE